MTQRKQISRKKYGELVSKNELSRIIYEEVLGKLGGYFNPFGQTASFSQNPQDYRFISDGNLCVLLTRLFDSPCNIQSNPLQIKHLVPGKHAINKVEKTSELLFGVKFNYSNMKHGGFCQTQASIGAYCGDEKGLENAVEDTDGDGFWPWDEILIQEEDSNSRKLAAKIWLHGEYPGLFDYGRYIARGVIDMVYQRVLLSLRIPQGEVVERYSDGNHPISVFHPGHGSSGWIGC